MSVEKFIVTKEDSGYTTLPNSVLQHLFNLEALGLWCYFQSKPPQWNFHKDEIRSIFGVGINKLDSLLIILKKHNLVEITQDRSQKGCFATWHLHVKNGTEFVPFNENHRTDKMHRSMKTVGTVNSTYKRKNTKKKDFKENKEKSFLDKKSHDNSKRHSFADSMDQMANEAKHTKKSNELKEAPIDPKVRAMLKGIIKR
jgi:hypothetical protein